MRSWRDGFLLDHHARYPNIARTGDRPQNQLEGSSWEIGGVG